ncbi:MAG: hypothetical protein WDM81_14775 [Rhizomicrobium sp.]
MLSDAATASQPFDVAYSEGADVGYRWFELRKLTPLFPFGFGLSYTTFDYRGFETKAATRSPPR